LTGRRAKSRSQASKARNRSSTSSSI
jgi:hypothetical protein